MVFADWHGDTRFALEALHQADLVAPDVTEYVHLGDFGVWYERIFRPGAEEVAGQTTGDIVEDQKLWAESGLIRGYMATLDEYLRAHDKILIVVLGNHENYWELDETFGFSGFFRANQPDIVASDTSWTDPAAVASLRLLGDPDENGAVSNLTGGVSHFDEDGFVMSPYYTNIRVVPRTHTWRRGDTVYASLGGACSIDRFYRNAGREWWPEEEPTSEQAATLSGVNADVLFTHEAPAEAVDILYPPGKNSQWDERALKWANRSPKVISEAVVASNAKRVICGHHHTRREFDIDGVKIDILASNIEGSLSQNRLMI